MTLTSFESLLGGVTATAVNQYRAEVFEDWLQGRSAFGGLSGALVANALRQPVEVGRTSGGGRGLL